MESGRVLDQMDEIAKIDAVGEREEHKKDKPFVFLSLVRIGHLGTVASPYLHNHCKWRVS